MTAADEESATVPFLVQDRLYLRPGDTPPEDDILLASPVGSVTIRGEGPFEDGPAIARVAVIDTDAATGVARPGARLAPRRGRRRTYRLDVDVDADSPVEAFESDAFIQVSCFATVMRTIMLFEGADGVGRHIPWACGSRITVIPRAGLEANARYVRETASLEFSSFTSPDGYLVHAALSHDVVSHETGHALIDGLLPDLYDAITPQSLAIHEAVADVAALALTLLNEQIVFSIFNISGGQVDGAEALARLAEEFGANARHSLGATYLRSASNERTLDPAEPSKDRFGVPNAVDRTDPHAVSEVLTGAVFSVFKERFDDARGSDGGLGSGGSGRFASPDERAVSVAAKRVLRMVFRALDHLPPGEISFADVGRAIIAADAANTGPANDRERLMRQLVRRGVVDSAAELHTPIGVAIPAGERTDPALLRTDDDAARAFAERHRTLLGIPDGRPFEVLPRSVLPGSGRRGRDRLAFRVRWTNEEEHDIGPRFSRRWVVPAGTTLILDGPDGGRAATILTTDTGTEAQADRGAMLRRWAAEGLLLPGESGADPVVGAAIVAPGGRAAQRVTGTARFLHVMGRAG